MRSAFITGLLTAAALVWAAPAPAADITIQIRGNGFLPHTLTVNHDPGRGTKYAGCLLIVFGIGTMFYMRAYFFKPRPRPT